MLLWMILVPLLMILLWYLVSHSWTESVRNQQQVLHDGMTNRRYGWRCVRCGKVYLAKCGQNRCQGALMWVGGKNIICSRCSRQFVAHPWLFRKEPISWPHRCKSCGWTGIVRQWEVD